MEGLLFVVSGPSGAGKGTICGEVVRRTEVELSVSATTRSPRKGEVHGKDYFFMTEEEFLEIVRKDGFVEYVENFGKHYGTPEAFVREKLKSGRDLILEIDVQGAAKIRRKFPQCVQIFILPPSLEELKRRILSRGTESPESVALRLKQAMDEVECLGTYDYFIVNDQVEQAVEAMISIISAQHNKVGNRAEEIIRTFKEA